MLNDAKQTAQKLLIKNKLLFVFCMLFIMLSLFLVCYLFFFRSITIDATKDLDITYEGESGSATIYVRNTSKNLNQRTQEFLNSISYQVTPKTNLSNGTIVQLNATFDETLANKYHIEVINETKEITVEGLAERFNSPDEINEDFRKALDAQAENYFKRSMDTILKEDFTDFYVTSNTQLVGKERTYRVLLQALNKENKDKIVDIYKITAKGMVNQASDHEDLVEKELTIYYLVTYDHINTKMVLKDENIYGEKLITTKIESLEDLETALRQKYLLSYTFTKIE